LFVHHCLRLVTLVYFPATAARARPGLSIHRRRAGARVADLALRSRLTEPEWALGYRFDIVLRGPGSTHSSSARGRNLPI
jgi:hypothetical protein